MSKKIRVGFEVSHNCAYSYGEGKVKVLNGRAIQATERKAAGGFEVYDNKAFIQMDQELFEALMKDQNGKPSAFARHLKNGKVIVGEKESQIETNEKSKPVQPHSKKEKSTKGTESFSDLEKV